jgi:hypothetical protein
VKLVPQSGSAVFICLVAQAARNIGMNARTTSSGVCRPITATANPSVAASEYAGAVEATPTATLANMPSAPDSRPLDSTTIRSEAVESMSDGESTWFIRRGTL